MKIEDYTPKELEELLSIAKKRKAQISAEFKAKLDKTIAGIEWLENRLGGNVTGTPSKSKVQKTAETVKAPATVSVAETSRRFQKNAGKILNLLNVQITPSTECVEPNDSIIKALFGKSSKKISVKEKHKSKRKPAVVSNLNVQGTAVTDTPLSEYDRAVFAVLVSENIIENRYTTVNIIHRALIGKPATGDDGVRPRKNQESAIINSVAKLMGTVVDFSGVNDSLKKLKYTDKDGNELILRKDNLVSASIFDAKVNGQKVEGVIFFKENSPLFDIADAKSQIIRYPHELLNVPNQNNTPLVISLKKYVMRRICEIKLHSDHLKPTITFDDVFSKCKLKVNDKSARQDARNVIIKFLDHLKSQNFISDFEVKKERGKFSKITFKFDAQDPNTDE